MAAIARTTMPEAFHDNVTASNTRLRRCKCATDSASLTAAVKLQRGR